MKTCQKLWLLTTVAFATVVFTSGPSMAQRPGTSAPPVMSAPTPRPEQKAATTQTQQRKIEPQIKNQNNRSFADDTNNPEKQLKKQQGALKREIGAPETAPPKVKDIANNKKTKAGEEKKKAEDAARSKNVPAPLVKSAPNPPSGNPLSGITVEQPSASEVLSAVGSSSSKQPANKKDTDDAVAKGEAEAAKSADGIGAAVAAAMKQAADEKKAEDAARSKNIPVGPVKSAPNPPSGNPLSGITVVQPSASEVLSAVGSSSTKQPADKKDTDATVAKGEAEAAKSADGIGAAVAAAMKLVADEKKAEDAARSKNIPVGPVKSQQSADEKAAAAAVAVGGSIASPTPCQAVGVGC